MEEKPKQVIIMRKDLKMRKGKMIAQCGHGVLALFLDQINIKRVNGGIIIPHTYISFDEPLGQWLAEKFTKITVGVDSEEELLQIKQQLDEAGIDSFLVQDAGNTEFHGTPTYTCICAGPEYSDRLDPITGDLKLL